MRITRNICFDVDVLWYNFLEEQTAIEYCHRIDSLGKDDLL